MGGERKQGRGKEAIGGKKRSAREGSSNFAPRVYSDPVNNTKYHRGKNHSYPLFLLRPPSTVRTHSRRLSCFFLCRSVCHVTIVAPVPTRCSCSCTKPARSASFAVTYSTIKARINGPRVAEIEESSMGARFRFWFSTCPLCLHLHLHLLFFEKLLSTQKYRAKSR